MRWFVGKVVDLDDPMKLGRVRIRAMGVYDKIANDDLPWAQVVIPITQGTHQGLGQNLGVLVDSQVFGIFLDGKNSQLPLVVGTIPKEGDTNEKAKENYPYNKVYETERGHYKEYDDTEGKERIKEYHASGTHYEMLPDGSRISVIKVNETLIVEEGDIKIDVKQGNVILNVAGDVQATVSGNTTVDCSNTTITGDLRVGGGISVANDVKTDSGISLNNHKHNVTKVKTGTSSVKSEKPL